jgi:hypothetical protein
MVEDSEVELATLWTDRFGTMAGQVGRKIAVRAYQYLQGQTGAAYSVSGIVAA